MGQALKHVRFKPWKGKHYGSRSPFGIPVMILGESHYSVEGKISTFTRRVIKAVKSGKKKNSFYRNVAAAFLEEEFNSKQRRAFWDSVVFYNYVQSPLKRGGRPNGKMWSEAEQPFLEVLAWLKPPPRLIAVFGFHTWENTPDGHGTKVPHIKYGQLRIQCYEFRVGGGNSLAPKLKHPSRGLNLKQTRSVIQKALKTAGGHKFDN
jgi:hypothetical protein